MGRESDPASVVVVGAGIVGCQIAYHLAVDHEVTVLERENVAAGATGRSAGVIAPTMFYGDLPGVAEHANGFVREFDGTGEFAFAERDRLDFVTAAEEADARADAEVRAGDGAPVTYLTAGEVRSRYPGFEMDGYAGAVHYGDTGWVDPYAYADALIGAARDRGAAFETGVAVERVAVERAVDDEPAVDHDVVSGVVTDAGRYDADAVVVAAGWRTEDLLPDGVALPICPYRTQCVILRPDDPLDETFPVGRIGSEHLYFRSEHNGDLLVGGAHHTVEDPGRQSANADESFKQAVADAIPSFVSGFDRATFVNGWSGIDVATPDTRPVIDAPPGGPDGLVVATGFNGLGVMISPVAGPIVRERLGGDSPSFSTDPFAIGRFDDVGAEFEYVSTSEL